MYEETEFDKSAKLVIESALKVKPDEKVSIVADKTGANENIGKALLNAGLKVVSEGSGTAKLTFVEELGMDLPVGLNDRTKALFEGYDVLIYAIQGNDTVKSEVRGWWVQTNIIDGKNCRGIGMPGVTKSNFLDLIPIDYGVVYDLCKKICDLMDGKDIQITTPAGTNINFTLKHIKDTQAELDCARVWNPGQFGNLPGGETFWEPINVEAFNGHMVVDGTFGNYEGLCKPPVEFDVKDGYIEMDSMTGNSKVISWFKDEIVKEHGKAATFAFECGVGTNPLAKLYPEVNTLEAEKVCGTCHTGFGKDKAHNDCIMLSPTIFVDGKPVMRGESSIGKTGTWDFL